MVGIDNVAAPMNTSTINAAIIHINICTDVRIFDSINATIIICNGISNIIDIVAIATFFEVAPQHVS